MLFTYGSHRYGKINFERKKNIGTLPCSEAVHLEHWPV